MKRSLRNNNEDWLLGSGLERSLEHGSKLPMKRTVMKRFFYLRQKDKDKPTRDICKKILEELNVIWGKAYLPMLPEKKCLDLLVTLHDQWIDLKKIKVKSRDSIFSKEKVSAFQSSLDQLCDFSPPDTLEQLKATRLQTWTEDYEFLRCQRMFPQVGCINGLDRSLVKRNKRIALRSEGNQSTDSRTRLSRLTTSNSNNIDVAEISTDEELPVRGENERGEDKDFRPTSRCSRPNSAMLEVPTKNLTAITGAVALSRGLSVRDHTAIQASFITGANGDVNDFSLSVSTTWRHNRVLRKETAEQILKSWNKPPFCIVHYDSKLIKYISGLTDDRIAVLISGHPQKTPKLLGIPNIPDSTGDSQHKAVFKLLEEWKTIDNIVGAVFDTTSSNSGRWKGSVTLIERRLNHPILWLACRHHVYELHIKHVAEVVMGKRNSPSEGLFRRFQKEWNDLDRDVNDLCLFDFSEVSEDLQKQAVIVRDWGVECLQKKTFPREDYRELLELTVIFLGGDISRTFVIRKPGANHHARFMAYAIYFLKMQMMSERFQMSQNERTEVKRMSTFVAICHSEAFLKSRLSTIAPALDIHYLLLMKLYEKDDKFIAQAALKSILNHLWYLCEETVIFAVFDKKLSPFTRKSMVDKLLTFPRPESIPVGKPKFPADLINKSNVSDSLLSCIGPRSWLLFFLLKKDEELTDWMKAPVECWQHMVGYQKIESFIKTLEVVNDCAERGVKLMTDFKDVSNNEEQQQYIMQVVEAHRRNFPSFNKNNLSHINQISD